MAWTDFRRQLRMSSSSPPVCQHQRCPQNGKVLEAVRYYIRLDRMYTIPGLSNSHETRNKSRLFREVVLFPLTEYTDTEHKHTQLTMTKVEIWPPRKGGNPSPNTAPMSPSKGLFKIPSCKHSTASLTNRETSLYCTSESEELLEHSKVRTVYQWLHKLKLVR